MRRIPRSGARPRLARAFTLVELLVVIGVMTVLAALLLAAVGRAQLGARKAKCGNNLRQIYAAARTYAASYDEFLPDLYAGLPQASQLERYVLSHYSRSPGPEDTVIPAGLWLLYRGDYARSKEVYYCPDLSGSRRYDGTENRAVDGIPQMVGYAYNCFPDRVTGESSIAFTEGMTPEETSNDTTQPRHMSFYALMGDVFYNAEVMPHWASRGTNCCYWDGSMQWASLTAQGILWNSQADVNGDGVEEKVFSADRNGAIATRDTWVLLSKSRK